MDSCERVPTQFEMENCRSNTPDTLDACSKVFVHMPEPSILFSSAAVPSNVFSWDPLCSSALFRRHPDGACIWNGILRTPRHLSAINAVKPRQPMFSKHPVLMIANCCTFESYVGFSQVHVYSRCPRKTGPRKLTQQYYQASGVTLIQSDIDRSAIVSFFKARIE